MLNPGHVFLLILKRNCSISFGLVFGVQVIYNSIVTERKSTSWGIINFESGKIVLEVSDPNTKQARKVFLTPPKSEDISSSSFFVSSDYNSLKSTRNKVYEFINKTYNLRLPYTPGAFPWGIPSDLTSEIFGDPVYSKDELLSGKLFNEWNR